MDARSPTPKIDATEGAARGLASIATLPELTQWRVRATPAAEAYRWYDRAGDSWKSYSWREIDAVFAHWGRALAAEGLSKGDRVAILMPNGVEHVAMDQAALAAGLVPVPLHAIDNPDSIAYILRDAGAAVLLLDYAERWLAILKCGDVGPRLKRVVCAKVDRADLTADRRMITLGAWLQAAEVATNSADVRPGDLAAIVYTSGTTGRPKGVMLSHENVVANVKAIARRLPPQPDDVFLSFLPLSHTFERTGGYYFPIAAGACVVFARSVQQLADDLKQVHPTVLISVPRIYERIYARIMERRGALGRLQRAMFDLALSVGARRFDARQRGMRVSILDRLVWLLLDRSVAARVRAEFGGRLRVAVSGGAPISESVIRPFLALGLDVLQGYGMTESSPVVAVNTPEENDPRSVGRALDGVEVRLGENDELLVRGPNVMMGYWNRPDDTARVKEDDGWLHTGDQARIVDRRIFITGRIKDIIVTSTGEKIAPVDLETAILADPLFLQAMVVGENRPYLAVLAVLDSALWEREQAALSAAGAAAGRAQTEFLLKRIMQAVRGFPAYATPRAVWWSTQAWTIDAGLLTPTLKNKRAAIETRFAAEIAKLYARRPAA